MKTVVHNTLFSTVVFTKRKKLTTLRPRRQRLRKNFSPYFFELDEILIRSRILDKWILLGLYQTRDTRIRENDLSQHGHISLL